MPGCCAINCSESSRNGVRLFLLPQGLKNTNRRNKWIQNICRKDLPNRACVCEKHFTRDQFENNRADGKRPLRWNAVPTIFSHTKRFKQRKEPATPLWFSTEDNDYLANFNMPSDDSNLPTNSTDEAENSQRDSENTLLAIVKVENLNLPTNSADEEENLEERDSDDDEFLFNEDDFNLPTNSTDEVTNSDSISKNELTNILNVQRARTSHFQLQRQLKSAQKEIRKLKEESENLKNKIKIVFDEDQIEYLKRGKMTGGQWQNSTIKKALSLYVLCGTTGYNELRKQNYPLPCIRTLQKRHKDFKSHPEMCEIFPLLEVKMDCIKSEEMSE